MPVLAIVASAVSFVGASAAFSAAAAAASVGAMVTAGAAMAGSVLTILGTVTGNSKLAMLGGVMTLGAGLAGGIANPFGGAEAAAGGAATAGLPASSAAEMAAEGAASAGVGGGAELMAPATAAADAVKQPGLLSTGEQAPTAVPANAPAQPSAPPATTAPGASTPFSTPKIDPLATRDAFTAPGITTASDLKAMELQSGLYGDASVSDFAAAAGSAPPNASDPNFISRMSQWAKDYPEMAKILAETGKGVAGSLVTSPKDQATIGYYNASADALRQKTEDERRKALWRRGLLAEPTAKA